MNATGGVYTTGATSFPVIHTELYATRPQQPLDNHSIVNPTLLCRLERLGR